MHKQLIGHFSYLNTLLLKVVTIKVNPCYNN